MPSTTASRSASSKTITGALPPSSRCVRLSVPEAACRILRPVATSPVTETMRTFGCLTSGWPTLAPRPQTTLSTPSRQDLGRELREQQRGQRRLLATA